MSALVEARDRQLRAEYAAHSDRRAAALAQVADLEQEIGRLVAAIAQGRGSSDMTAAIADRRASVEVLRATPPEPPRFDRGTFLAKFAGSRIIDMLLERSYPKDVRRAIEYFGVQVVVTPSETGPPSWTFEGSADLTRLIDGGVPGTASDTICAAFMAPSASPSRHRH